jgi:tagatose 1,6-diphosphate aldolase
MPHDLSAGKLRGLMSLAGDGGTFEMIAVDQRPPIFRALARHGDRRPDEVAYDEVAAVKTLLTRVLAPHASAVLLDPVWTHPHALRYVPGRVGLLSTLEGYDFDLVAGERRSHPIRHWSVAKIRSSGAQGVKVLAWHRPDVSPETAAHQDAFVEAIGAACREHDLPYVLELLIYPFEGEDPDSVDYARAKPERVLASVRHFADERFGVDLLKLEFPADLKRTREYAAGAFDGVARESAYGLDEVRAALHELNASTHVPWVLLSAGVGPDEFEANLALAFAAGASGFLAGRAVWLDALDVYPDMAAVEARLRRHSLPYLRRIAALAETATPWQRHPRFGGEAALAGAAPDWLEGYGA